MHANTETATYLIKFMDVFMFGEPGEYLRALDRIYVDGLVYETAWAASVKTLKAGWDDYVVKVCKRISSLFLMIMIITQATVLLAASVSFQSIPGIDNTGPASWGQVASMLTVILSMGSMMTGYILSRRHKANADQGPDEAVS